MHGYYSAAIPFEGGKHGMGILTRERPLRVRRLALPGTEEARTCMIAEFSEYIFCGTHLSVTDTDQIASLQIIVREAEKTGKPFFLAGDLNCEPGSRTGQWLGRNFILLSDTAHHTWPADKPVKTIDYIALYKNNAARSIVKLKTRMMDETKASDHRAVYADIRFRISPEKLFFGEPYLQDMTDDGITVMFQTRTPVSTWIEYGTDTLHLQSARTLLAGQEPCLGLENSIRLDGIQRDVKYYYRVCAREVQLNEAYYKILGNTVKTPFYSFTLPSSHTQDFTAFVMNDLHERDDVMQRLLEVVRQKGFSHFDFGFYNGDCVPDPYGQEHTIVRVNKLMTAVNASECFTTLIRGNHEIRNAYSAGLVSLMRNFGGKTYGAFTWGNTRFVVLDCSEDKPDSTWGYYGLNDFSKLRKDQVEFLKKEISSKAFRKAHHHILLNHIPIWGEDDVYTDGFHPWTALWEPLLKKAGFDIDIVAHAHNYYFYEKGVKGNPVPQYGGGSPSLGSQDIGTIAILQSRGESLRLIVFDAAGNKRLDREL